MMRYWWVSQNRTYRQERQGGYLWAPKRDSSGKTPFHWRNITKVTPGDIVYSYVSQSIFAIGRATSFAHDFLRPETFEREWERDGWKVDIDYRDIRPPKPVADFVDDLMPLLPEQFGPLDRNRNGRVGYLFELPKIAAEFVEQAVNGQIRKQSESKPLPTATFRTGERVINQKFGSGIVTDVENNRIHVAFDSGQTRVVVPSYLRHSE